MVLRRLDRQAGRGRHALAAVGLVVVVGACSATPPGPDGATDAHPVTGPSTGSAGSAVAGVVDVGGGRTLYLECYGTGSPTVVLQAGFANAGDIWQVSESRATPVAVGVAAFTRVCLYDRPGSYVSSVDHNGSRSLVTSTAGFTPARGGAAFPAAPPTGTALVRDLHALLAAAQVRPPFVLVGHSLGGVLSLLYARTYPEQVSGLTLVDPLTPNFPQRLSPAAWAGNISALAEPGPSQVAGYANERYRLDVLFDEIDRAAPLPRISVIDLVRTVNDDAPNPLPAGLTAAGFEEIQTQGLAAAAAYLGLESSRSRVARTTCTSNAPTSSSPPCASK
ncbi:MAG: alpha/beta hydrolase [Lapillicoccus sp.]